jgi:hypothetical protein
MFTIGIFVEKPLIVIKNMQLVSVADFSLRIKPGKSLRISGGYYFEEENVSMFHYRGKMLSIFVVLTVTIL